MVRYRNYYLLKNGNYISGGTDHDNKSRAELHSNAIMSNEPNMVLNLAEYVRRSDIVSVTTEIDNDSIGE